MRILLLSNQPERTTRLMMFKGTLEKLGYEVIIPRFSTRSWLGVAGETKRALQKEKPDVVHLFNVPDVIYHNIGKLKGSCFQKLIYDYRSPWGVELQMAFGPLARPAGEYFERELAGLADMITAVNRPLAEKVSSYSEAKDKHLFIVPNYPARSFLEISQRSSDTNPPDEKAIIFMGRISRQPAAG